MHLVMDFDPSLNSSTKLRESPPSNLHMLQPMFDEQEFALKNSKRTSPNFLQNPINSPLFNRQNSTITIAKLLSDRNKMNLKERYQCQTEEDENKITEVVLEETNLQQWFLQK